MKKNHANFSGNKNPNFGNRQEKNPLYGKKKPKHSEKMRGNKFSCGKRSKKAKIRIGIANLKRAIIKLEKELEN